MANISRTQIGLSLSDYNTVSGKYLGARPLSGALAEDFLIRLTAEVEHLATSPRTYHRIMHQVYNNVW